MDFPSIGDAPQYLEVATACAHFLLGSDSPGATCYHDYRPIGIVLYYALPLLFTDDPILVSYITLFQNLLFLMLLVYAGLTLLRRFSGVEADTLRSRVQGRPLFGDALLVILITLFSIGYISVRLSDLQSLTLFLLSFCLLSADGLNPSKGKAFLAGILIGASILMKQNFAVSAVLIVPLWLALVGRRDIKSALPPLIFFCCGASLGFVQILWVYLHSGMPWLYDPRAMAVFDSANRQPYVELAVYMEPTPFVYFSKLVTQVPEFQYFATKFWNGLSKFYWAVYAGRPPADALLPIINYTAAEVTGTVVAFLLVALLSFASIASGQPWLALLVITAFCSVSLNMAIAHVENRYFYFLRVVFVIYFIALARLALARWQCRRALAVPASADPK
ncbi:MULTISPECIES: hypothetical protein [Pseudomonas]|jgi:hypothetical protein|uniref:Glycosyltransferase RgtA/B/C/D-like domain-containing protein n=1 Tax=Pseudomonas fluorescens TaxID=294 RepID=A0A5E6SL98_PSEFL|nr:MULTISPECIES: hypothetical protein [Pseudomonas]QHF49912.1 hypothetical protein PspS49_09785 [Pseudomonas sp. S49]VVM80962.1 hypothetical protein PS624_02310 [Pseudomonas fluorescens]